MTTDKLINRLINSRIETVFKLRTEIRFLQDQLKNAELRLDEGKVPNSAGVVQQMGSHIDMSVAALATIDEALEALKTLKEGE